MSKAEIIKTQAQSVAKTARTNMFSVNDVFEIAVEMGFHELCDFIFAHTDLYSKLILTGELPAEIDEVNENV